MSKKLYYLLGISVFAAWLSWPDSSEKQYPDTYRTQHSSANRTSQPALIAERDTHRPWLRVIEVPAVKPEVVLEPPPPPPPPQPVYIPPPPPPPAAPSLPVEYLGQARLGNNRLLYIRYQGNAMKLKVGQKLGEDYRLKLIGEGAATFEYIPLGESQELVWE
ncbi:hypothetical protein [Halopseudomonas sabulinigri]|uniref:Secretion system X translation initiation factor n=1 Tax=Halopseudomonas sabulinigri TaxID=472181 RepID=A0ABP9ZUQ9_9GAMM